MMMMRSSAAVASRVLRRLLGEASSSRMSINLELYHHQPITTTATTVLINPLRQLLPQFAAENHHQSLCYARERDFTAAISGNEEDDDYEDLLPFDDDDDDKLTDEDDEGSPFSRGFDLNDPAHELKCRSNRDVYKDFYRRMWDDCAEEDDGDPSRQ